MRNAKERATLRGACRSPVVTVCAISDPPLAGALSEKEERTLGSSSNRFRRGSSYVALLRELLHGGVPNRMDPGGCYLKPLASAPNRFRVRRAARRASLRRRGDRSRGP